MGVGFVGNNTTLKLTGGGKSVATATTTHFTTAADEYADVYAYGSTGMSINIGGAGSVAVQAGAPNRLLVPPGNSFATTATGFAYIVWTIFKNSP
jgi:hypothetical protein